MIYIADSLDGIKGLNVIVVVVRQVASLMSPNSPLMKWDFVKLTLIMI